MNLIFDIGNVICRWDPEGLVSGIFATPAERRQALEYVIGHPDWQELDRGALTLEQAVDNSVARCSLAPHKIRALYDQTPASLTPITPVVDLIRTLASRGQALYVLSNMQAHTWDYLARRHDFWSLFRGIVISSRVGMLKPEPAIYRYITREYGLAPPDTLFLDDLPVNVSAALEQGLQAVCVRDAGDVIEAVNRITGPGS